MTAEDQDTSALSDEIDHLNEWIDAYFDSRRRSPSPAGDATNKGELLERLRRAQSCLAVLRRAWRKDEAREDTPHDETDLYTAHTQSGAGLPFSRLGRFIVLDRLGSGSHGIVYKALDPVLGREVALKVARPETLTSLDLRRRFIREAQALAALSHPNLVTVYEAGAIGDACFIAFEYCEGLTLSRWLKQLSATLELRLAARMVSSLAEALHYVHSHGILHRDLKPSNILLQKSEVGGQKSEVGLSNSSPSDFCSLTSDLCDGLSPKITDFGLAKIADSGGSNTRPGDIVGTPRYMAPEQALGLTSDVGPATDVYSLGAILFEVLTGQPVFPGPSEAETLRRVAENQVMSPRAIRRDIPRELEAICLKCLEFDPGRRYATANALAQDLQCWLRGEAVAARKAGPVRLLAKWARRRPAVAALTGSLLLAVTAGFAAVTWQWRAAEAMRRRSEANFRQAHLAVSEFHNLLFRRDEYDAPEFRPLRFEVLQKAADYYRGFQRQHTDDPALIADIADAYYHLGGILQAEGNRQGAAEWFERALPLWEQTDAVQPHVTHRVLLMRTCNRLGLLYLNQGRLDEALTLYERSRALIGMLSDDGRGGSLERDRAAICSGLVRLYAHDGEDQLVLEQCLQWLQVCERLCQDRKGEDTDLLQLSAALRRTAQALNVLGRSHDAVGYGERSCAVLEELMQRDALTPGSTDGLAHSLNSLAAVHRSLGNLPESLRSFQRAHEIWERLAIACPQRKDYRQSLANNCRYLAACKDRLGDLAAAESLHLQSCQLVDELARCGFDDRELTINRAMCYSEFARFKTSISQTDEALKLYQTARPLLREIVAKQPTNFFRRDSLSRLCLDYGRLAEQSGRLFQALDAYEEAATLAQCALNAKPGDQKRQQLLAACTAEGDRLRTRMRGAVLSVGTR